MDRILLKQQNEAGCSCWGVVQQTSSCQCGTPVVCIRSLLFFVFINALQVAVSSQACLFADDCILYRPRARVAQCVTQLDYLATRTSLSPIRRGLASGFVNYKKGALVSQPQVIKLTSCLPMVGGSLRVLRLLPPLKLFAMIQLKVALNTKNQSIINRPTRHFSH